MDAGVLIIGASHAGVTLAAVLRRQGYTSGITLLSEETTLPYERPPLSKLLLTPRLKQDILPTQFYAENAIDLRLGAFATSLDLSRSRVVLADGQSMGYDCLVLATGATVRQSALAPAGTEGVYYLRNYRDAIALDAKLRTVDSVVIIGGGWIGLEIASSARKEGLAVTLIERETRLLARVASRDLSLAVEAEHRRQGVEVVCGADLAGVASDRGTSRVITLVDGRSFRAGAVVVAIGATPRGELAVGAGIEYDAGIIVDSEGRTSAEGVFAIGDVTRRQAHGFTGHVRLESIPSSTEQAKRVAATIMRQDLPLGEVPFFWSDQFGMKIRLLGAAQAAASVVRKSPDGGPDTFVHMDAGRILGIEALTQGPDIQHGRRLIRDGVQVVATRVADGAQPLPDAVDEALHA